MDNEIIPPNQGTMTPYVDEFYGKMCQYLDTLSLPTTGVLVPTGERFDVFNNLEKVVNELQEDNRLAAMYISKFVAACAVGLFDAALNYIWDETIRNLRQKVEMFDLEYFFEAVVTDPAKRASFKGASDIEKLADWELIRGCSITGLITQHAFRHLDYIRDMRNHASAAHPNQNDISGLQLVGWLQTCIREVLAKPPEGAVIEVRRLLRSIRNEEFTKETAVPISEGIQNLPPNLLASLGRSLFGMYTDQDLDTDIRNNITFIAPALWGVLDESLRNEIGLRQASFSANGEVSRAKLAHNFLSVVDGLAYLSDDVRSLEISTVLDGLITAHYGRDNFYNEAPFADSLRRYIPDNGLVPKSVLVKYVKTLTLCRIGNGYGVSWTSLHIYSELIRRWQDREAKVFAFLSGDQDVSSRLQFPKCSDIFQKIAAIFSGRVTNRALQRLLDFIAKFPENQLPNVSRDQRFLDLKKAII